MPQSGDVIMYDDEEYGDYECDVCGIPLYEDEVYIIRDFFGEGMDGHFCHYHYSQVSPDNDEE